MLRFIESLEPKWLKRIHIPNWLVLVLALVFLFRIPSLFEPFYYGDEMIYLTLGEAIRRGMVLYRDIHDNKPPLLYFLAALSGNVFWFRAILTVWTLFTIISFWRLADSLFLKNKKIALGATVAFAILTTIPTFEGQIANAENFMIGLVIIALYLIISAKKLTLVRIISSGILVGLATLFKVPSIFDLGAIIFIWFLSVKNVKTFGEFFKNSSVLVISALLPIVVSVVWYYFRGALSEYWVAAFLQNFGYVSSWREGTQGDTSLTSKLPLIGRAGIVLCGLTTLWWFRKKLTVGFLFATAWFLFSLFASTLSERPYPHYILQVVPSLSLLIGILIASTKIDQSLTLFPFALLVLAILRFNFWYYPTLSYYENFVKFTTAQKSHKDYFAYFDKKTNRNYKIAEFLASSSKPEDKVFIWGDSPSIYALAKRLPPTKYVTRYHINDFSSKREIFGELTSEKPKFIIILPEDDRFAEINSYLMTRYILVEEIEEAKIWKYSASLSNLLQ